MLQYNNAFGARLARKISLAAALILTLSPLASRAATPHIVSSIKPLQMIAQAVAGDTLSIDRIVPDGANAHDYVLRPSDASKALHADLLIWLGPKAEPYLARIGTRAEAVQLDITQTPNISLLPARRLVEWDEHQHEHGHDTPFDQHLWLNTKNAATIAAALAKKFATLDAAHQADYLRNAENFKHALEQRTEKWQAQLTPFHDHYFIAYHDAYQYLEQQFEVPVATVLTLEPEIKPGAKHLLDVKSAIQTKRVSCFVTEPGFDPSLLKKVMPENAKQTVLDVHGSLIPLSTQSYFDFMDNIVKSLQDCLTEK